MAEYILPIGSADTVSFEVSGVPVIVDVADYERVASFRWRISRARDRKYPSTMVGDKTVGMHRLLLGDVEGMVVDHINGNPLDNRRANLRHVSASLNTQNQKRQSVTGYTGVQPHKGSFRAKFRGVRLGSFATAEEAAMAYDKAATAFYGPSARTNFGSGKPNSEFEHCQSATNAKSPARPSQNPIPSCGTTAKYNRGCKCDPCTEAHRNYMKEWREATGYKRSRLI